MGQPAADQNYLSIRLSVLRGDLAIPFDAYVRVNGKYISYCRRGDAFGEERLERLRAKNTARIYIRREELLAFEMYLNGGLQLAMDPKRPLTERAKIMQAHLISLIEDLAQTPLDELIYGQARHCAEHLDTFLAQDPLALSALLTLPREAPGLLEHMVNVAALALAIAGKQPKRENTTRGVLALGCLIHDIDELRPGAENVAVPLRELSPEAMARYRRHPVEGARMFQAQRHVDPLVLKIIAQHEELRDGSGFPQKFKKDDMDPYIMIAGVANAYDRLIGFENFTHKDALKHLLIAKMGTYPLGLMQDLQAILKSQNLV